jgi:hypothetical protein
MKNKHWFFVLCISFLFPFSVYAGVAAQVAKASTDGSFKKSASQSFDSWSSSGRSL